MWQHATAPGVEIRPLRTGAEFAACVRLQRETWGSAFNEIVPESVLQLAQRLGGMAAGAFAGDDLVGFVFGLTGLDDGRPTHWSHMLAVRAAWRDRGVGRALKRYQRVSLAGTGVQTIAWTFDPLVARNAHLNLNRLGARVLRYVPDMYGNTGSDLHVVGTDRLVVALPVEGPWPRGDAAAVDATAAPIVNGEALPPAAAAVRIEIPAALTLDDEAGVRSARSWRLSSRAAFLRCLADDFAVRGFLRTEADRCFYLLAREDPA